MRDIGVRVCLFLLIFSEWNLTIPRQFMRKRELFSILHVDVVLSHAQTKRIQEAGGRFHTVECVTRSWEL
jgi:hypothetical protein